MSAGRFAAVAVLSLLVACASAEPTPGEGPPPMDDEVSLDEGGGKEPGLADIELCDAEDYRPLIGTNIAAATLPADPMLRAYGVNDIITQEYLPQRTNILYGTDGVIQRVYCG